MKKNLFLVSFFILLFAHPVFANHCANQDIYRIGAAKHDITGPAAEDAMMGYGMIKQKTTGIYQRLWARAFVIESPCNGKQVAIVIADLGQVFQGVKVQVIARLKKLYGDTFNDDNVLLAATHTHSGPGGYSTDFFYNITSFGFDRNNFDAIVDGIVAAIDQAHQNKVQAKIKVAEAALTGLNHNRSPQAYLKNPAKERASYPGNTDEVMSLLRFESLAGEEIGALNWFPVHGTSMNNKNLYINGDNKGYAAYLFENQYRDPGRSKPFIAAFAQANAGDVTPNPDHHQGGSGIDGIHAVEKAGLPQFKKAFDLFSSAREPLKGEVDYRHKFYAFNNIEVLPRFTKTRNQRTCSAAIGVSMLAGTEDGEGFGRQGMTCDNVDKVLPYLACQITTAPCQGVKPVALNTGRKWPYPWTPNILPIQLVKIGQFTIAALPFEPTTMSGRRIRQAVKEAVSVVDTSHIVISGLANAYAGYVATPEEYSLQRYEGASTHFGPWTLAAIQQGFAELGEALRNNQSLDSGPLPVDHSKYQIHMQSGIVMDSKPADKAFGDVYQDVNAIYQPGDRVEVVFWGGHPKNNLHIQGSFLEVQRYRKGKWEVIRNDNDWDTEYRWQREKIDYSLVKISWRIPKNIAIGQYRIVHYGDWKALWSRKVSPYVGYSGIFSIKNS